MKLFAVFLCCCSLNKTRIMCLLKCWYKKYRFFKVSLYTIVLMLKKTLINYLLAKKKRNKMYNLRVFVLKFWFVVPRRNAFIKGIYYLLCKELEGKQTKLWAHVRFSSIIFIFIFLKACCWWNQFCKRCNY